METNIKMCGIFLYYTKDGIIRKELMKQLMFNYSKIEHRGPDKHTLSLFGNCLAGFHRLSINDLTSKGDQPFELNNDFLMCNGEIYNYHELQQRENFLLKSKSDCEILLHLFQRYGVKESIQMLDGVFAIVYVTSTQIYMIRDRVGVKPLFYTKNDDMLTIASEPISLEGKDKIEEVLPSSILSFSKDLSKMYNNIYYEFPSIPLYTDEQHAISMVNKLLTQSVKKRLYSDRSIGCLLSGGLDSSIIASILSKELGNKLKTFSVGFPDSTDIIYARKVAQYLNTDHHEYLIHYETALQYIPTVIQKLGSYDTTTIRASTPMYMLCEWISQNFKEKVIFSGEGSDEMFCGYLYSHNAPNSDELFQDSLRLVKQLYKYDVLRSDRCTAGNSLEFREPFLDKELMEFVLQTSGDLRKPKEFEKDLLRKAFEGYLPQDVLWRRKAAFSDAVSSSEKPWYRWIQEYVETNPIVINDFNSSKESNYYKTIFRFLYKSYSPEIPLWLPKWCDTGDEPSATVLKVYDKKEH